MNHLLFPLILMFSLISPLEAQEADIGPEAKAAYSDIKKTLGSLPTFLKEFPQEGLPGAWEDMKGIQLNPNTVIPGKYKELIGLAVSAQIPCNFCVYFHTQAAMLHGASSEEINEAIAIAANSRRWNTFLEGTQAGYGEFRQDVDKLLKIATDKKNQQAMEVKPAVLKLETPQDAYQDIRNTLGFVPGFMMNYPQTGIVGAWKELKAVEFNPATSIPVKYKQLIGLAVASQIPSKFTTYYHTQSAIFENANKNELSEAVAMAAITRHWSTVLNGQHTDEKQFRGEVDTIMKFLKSKSAKEVTLKI
jgi:AhpD family alkylhydroperoxidase